MKNYKNAFTLVELLAVIVILSIVLIIAMPQIINVVRETQDDALLSSAKLIASAAEIRKESNDIAGVTEIIMCDDVFKITEDYGSCYIEFDAIGKAKVTISGANKFKGKHVCDASSEVANISEEKCPSIFEKHDWDTIVELVEGGKYPYQVGDTKEIDLGTLGMHVLRIANTTPCDDTLSSQTACGFVLEFADVIKTGTMNAGSSNVGGWPASAMRTYVNGTLYNAIPKILRDEIINTQVISSHGNTSSEQNFESTDMLYLFSPEEIYGVSFTNDNDTSIGTSRQLDYYKDVGVTTENSDGAIKYSGSTASVWWLRSATFANNTNFFRVYSSGVWGSKRASYSHGISPAFRIG